MTKQTGNKKLAPLTEGELKEYQRLFAIWTDNSGKGVDALSAEQIARFGELSDRVAAQQRTVDPTANASVQGKRKRDEQYHDDEFFDVFYQLRMEQDAMLHKVAARIALHLREVPYYLMMSDSELIDIKGEQFNGMLAERRYIEFIGSKDPKAVFTNPSSTDVMMPMSEDIKVAAKHLEVAAQLLRAIAETSCTDRVDKLQAALDADPMIAALKAGNDDVWRMALDQGETSE